MGIHIQEINIIVTHEVTNFIFPLIFFYNILHDVSKGNQVIIWWFVNHTNNYIFFCPKDRFYNFHKNKISMSFLLTNLIQFF